MKVLLIPADSSKPIREVIVSDDDEKGLKEWQGLVGGLIEEAMCPGGLQRRVSLICNDEGKLKHLPRNDRATRYWQQLWGLTPVNDYLAGDVIVCGGVDGVGNSLSVPADVLPTLMARDN